MQSIVPMTEPFTDPLVWCIRAGRGGDANALFLTEGVVALGLDMIGDLRAIQSDLASFKAKIARVYSDKTTSAVTRNASQLLHFFQTVRLGHLIVYPSRIDGEIHIGHIAGEYQFDPSLRSEYPHRRKVAWVASVSREYFSQDALFEMGAPTSLFRIRRHPIEFQSAARGGPPAGKS
jgi:restriction system protein